MTLVVTHPYVSSIAESTASGVAGGLVGPNEWNANHTLTGVAAPAQGGTGITSGTGVTYFSSATVIADSGTLTANSVLVGGGANVAPKFDGNFTYGAAGGGVSIILTSSTSTNAGLSIVTSSSSNMAANASALNIAATWNNSGITYDAPLFMNITNTASGTSSLLADFQVGSSTVAAIVEDGSFVGPSFAFSVATSPNPGSTLTALRWVSANRADLYLAAVSGQAQFSWNTSGLGYAQSSNMQFSWSSSTNNAGNSSAWDTTFYRDGVASVVGLSNSNTPTSAAGLRVYNTTDHTGSAAPTNYERGVFDWTTTANTLTVGAQAGGTGTLRNTSLVGTQILVPTGTTSAPAVAFAASSGIGIYNNGGQMGFCVANTVPFSYFTQQVAVASNAGLGFVSGTNAASGANDSGFNRVATKVIAFTDGGTGTSAVGWMQWAGESRVAANSTTTSTALANVPGLAFLPRANRNYSFEAHLIFTDAATGGIQCTVNATSTTTTYTLTFDGWVTDTTAVRGYAQGSAFGNPVASSLTTGTIGHVTITGTLMTSATAPSTVTIQFSQNTSNATPTTILIGSYMWAYDMP